MSVVRAVRAGVRLGAALRTAHRRRAAGRTAGSAAGPAGANGGVTRSGPGRARAPACAGGATGRAAAGLCAPPYVHVPGVPGQRAWRAGVGALRCGGLREARHVSPVGGTVTRLGPRAACRAASCAGRAGGSGLTRGARCAPSSCRSRVPGGVRLNAGQAAAAAAAPGGERRGAEHRQRQHPPPHATQASHGPLLAAGSPASAARRSARGIHAAVRATLRLPDPDIGTAPAIPAARRKGISRDHEAGQVVMSVVSAVRADVRLRTALRTAHRRAAGRTAGRAPGPVGAKAPAVARLTSAATRSRLPADASV